MHTKSVSRFARGVFCTATGLLCLACRMPSTPAGPQGWELLSVGSHYNCGLSESGAVYCWGGVGGYFQSPNPPDSIIENSAVPWRVPGDYRFQQISSGGLVMCGLNLESRAYCWGGNTYLEVGDGSAVAKRGPSAVVGGFRWRMINAGGAHVCGITLEGNAYCWGNNFRGALGLGNDQVTGASSEPLRVTGGHAFVAVWAGAGTTCAVTPQGAAYCWGINDFGRLGDGEPPESGKRSASPVRVVGNHRFVALTAGGYQVCGLSLAQDAYCWGWNRYGQLGDGTTNESSVPVLVGGGLKWSSISSGEFHTCGLTTDGAAYCWGGNEHGQLGTGDTVSVATPQLIAPSGTYISIGAGGRHTCGRTTAGTVFCWGRGDYGQLGHGVMRNELYPVQVRVK